MVFHWFPRKSLCCGIGWDAVTGANIASGFFRVKRLSRGFLKLFANFFAGGFGRILLNFWAVFGAGSDGEKPHKYAVFWRFLRGFFRRFFRQNAPHMARGFGCVGGGLYEKKFAAGIFSPFFCKFFSGHFGGDLHAIF
ncbi:MAG: hypothetical protein MPK30_09330 [Gammaproteobacteria bacterium]|nr:hypothetical protein [Gammaproteobacteria bacterium]